MTRTLQASILIVTFSFAGVSYADAIESAKLVFQNFFSSFTNADPEGVVSLFAENALFWGTGSQSLVQSTDGIESYFSGLSNRSPGQSVASALDMSILPLGEDQAMVSGTWQVVPNNQTEGAILRVSAVVANRSGEWKIVQFHNSRIPE